MCSRVLCCAHLLYHGASSERGALHSNFRQALRTFPVMFNLKNHSNLRKVLCTGACPQPAFLKLPRNDPKPGKPRTPGYIDWLYLDEDTRITRGSKAGRKKNWRACIDALRLWHPTATHAYTCFAAMYAA